MAAFKVHIMNYMHGLHIVVFCGGSILIFVPISFRVASLALGQSYDCPSASEATLKNMGKWIDNMKPVKIHNVTSTKQIFFFFNKTDYSDITWTSWCLKSLATPKFVEPFVQAHIKENIKTLHHWPLWGESTGA